MSHYQLIEVQKNENMFVKLALIGLIAVGLTGCVHIEIPEDCKISDREAYGIASNVLESGLGRDQAQAAVEVYCK